MDQMELKDINIEWSLQYPTRVSFRIRMLSSEGKSYIIIAKGLSGDVFIEEEKKEIKEK